MPITFTPQSRLTPLHYAQEGDVLTVNGRAYDFGPLLEGAVLPMGAVSGDWLCSDVTRSGGEIVLTAVEPNAATAPAPGPAGVIDWSRMRTAEEIAAEAQADWRAWAALARADFALAARAAGLVSDEEAEAWATGQSLPAIVTAALAGLPAEERVGARIRALASATVQRTHPLIALIAGHMGLSDAQVDALFGTTAPNVDG